MCMTMPWQPIPAPTSAPSGTFVEVLWGQPEQKNGARVVLMGAGFIGCIIMEALVAREVELLRARLAERKGQSVARQSSLLLPLL